MKVFIIAFFVVFTVSGQSKNNFDHSIFNKILKDDVTEKGLVNYNKIKDSKKFDKYLTSLAKAEVTKLEQDELLAFYINAYNAIVIENVNNLSPLKSPLADKGFFKKYKFTIAGKSMSLDELEYNYIFPIENILVHFGLVCAGMSCPKLLQKAYTAENVYPQLKENAKFFLNDTSRNKLDKSTSTLYLSEIFKWFKKSFIEKYGSLEKAFIELSGNKELAEYISKNEIKVKFMKYDWNLNSI